MTRQARWVVVWMLIGMAVGCGGYQVRPIDDLTSAPQGVPFRLRVEATQVTTYYACCKGDDVCSCPLKACDTAVFESRRRVVVPDMSKLHLFETKRSWVNPFASMKTTVVVNDDGTLKSAAYEADPQLDEAVAAVGGLAAFEGRPAVVPDRVRNNLCRVEVTYE